jgi:hypothetical protein
MPFTTGRQALQNAIKEAQEKAQERADGLAGPSLGYYNWKPGDKKIIRFLTDDILTEDFLTNIICKDGKTRSFLVDPDNPEPLRRYMSPTPGVGWKKEFSGEIVEPYTTRQTVNVAVWREEVLVEGKMVVRDHVTEKEFNGQKFPALFFGVVQQAISNFWEPLATSVWDRYQTICDRDLEVIRTGDKKNTNYGFMPLNQDPALMTQEAVQQVYFYGAEWNQEDPDRFKKCSMTLTDWAAYFSSEKRYERYFAQESSSTGGSSSGLDEFRAATTSNPGDEAQAVPPTGTAFTSLRESLLNKGQGS